MSSPATRYPLHRLSGQFQDPGQEAAYRLDIEPRVRLESSVALCVAALIFAMFAISDYHFVGLSLELTLLLAMRLVVAAACLTLAFVLRRQGSYLRHAWLHALPLWILATAIILIVPLRPESLSTQVSGVVVATMAFYLLIPNLIPVVVAASLYMGLGFLGAALMVAEIPAALALRLMLVLVMTNAVGFFALLRLETLQRTQFALLQEERVQNQQLTEEISRRRSLEAQLRSLAERDALTDLDSRSHFMQRAGELLRRAQVDRAPFSLFMIDADHFKTINDTWGHSQGDRVLAAIAEACRRTLRPQDVIGRFGGEEFIVALLDTHPKDAQVIAERLRQRVAALSFDDDMPGHRLAVTIGVAGVVDEATDLGTLIQRADQALYAGKRGGRNRVEMSQEA